MKIKHIIYNRNPQNPRMYAIAVYKDDNTKWVVKVIPCDILGNIVSDPVVYREFRFKWPAQWFFRKQYKEFDRYVNGRY